MREALLDIGERDGFSLRRLSYRVIIAEGAERRLLQHIEYLAFDQKMPLTAERWWRKAIAATDTLSTFPHRCPRVAEDSLRDYTIRGLRVDSQLFLYRVDEENKIVEVFAFRGGAELPRHDDLPKE